MQRREHFTTLMPAIVRRPKLGVWNSIQGSHVGGRNLKSEARADVLIGRLTIMLNHHSGNMNLDIEKPKASPKIC